MNMACFTPTKDPSLFTYSELFLYQSIALETLYISSIGFVTIGRAVGLQIHRLSAGGSAIFLLTLHFVGSLRPNACSDRSGPKELFIEHSNGYRMACVWKKYVR